MTAKISALRGFTLTGASFLLRITLGGSVLLCANSGPVQADPAPVEASEVTINPASGPVVLTLQGPTTDSAAAADYGLTLTYHDNASTGPAIAALKLYRGSGEYQWIYSASATDHSDRRAMRLANDHSLTIYDPAHPGDAASAIVLHPGAATDSASGIFWNGQQLATVQQVSAGFVPLVNGGFSVGSGVTIGTSTTPAALTVNGRIVLSPTTNANTGVIYEGTTPILHSYGAANFFVGPGAGNFTLDPVAGGHNLAIGVNAMPNVTTGSCNIAIGEETLTGDSTAGGNTAVGWRAMGIFATVDGGWNTAIGTGAGYSWQHGNFNVAVGYNSFAGGDGGWGSNVAVGPQTMFNAQGSIFADVAVGASALNNLNGGQYNTALGSSAGYYVSTGSYNTLVGENAGVWQNPPNYADSYYSLTTGNNNTFIGYAAGLGSATQRTNATAIGNMAKVDADNALVLGGTGDNAVNVGINTTTPQAKLDVNGDATVRGVLHVPPAGDIGMGDFTAGTNPNPPQP